jgi:hypothetical protein
MACLGRHGGEAVVQLQPLRNAALERGRCQLHSSVALPPEKGTVLIVHEADWASGPVWTDTEYLATTGFRSSDLSACNKSLYRLLSPVRHLHHTGIECIKYVGN